MHIILFIACIGLIAGYIDGIAGGGGLLTVPALLSVGLSPHYTLGTNKFAATFAVMTSARAYIKKGLFKPRNWISAIIAASIGAFFGVICIHFVSSNFLATLLPVIIICVAIYMLIPKKITTDIKENFIPAKLSSAIIGSILGFYDGFMGPGTGSFWTTLVMILYKIDIVRASGVARFMNFVSNISALVVFIAYGSINYKLGISLALGYVLGSYFGAHSAIKFGARFIKPVFIIVVIALAIKLIIAEWS